MHHTYLSCCHGDWSRVATVTYHIIGCYGNLVRRSRSEVRYSSTQMTVRR